MNYNLRLHIIFSEFAALLKNAAKDIYTLVGLTAMFNWLTGIQSSKTQSDVRRKFCLTFISVVISFSFFSDCYSQVTVSGALVGNGNYANLTGAFNGIKSGAQTGADIVIRIVGNVTEGSAQLTNGAWNSIVIKPDGGATRTITGFNNGAMIDFFGADKVTIDGLNSGGNSLTISNTSMSAASGVCTIGFGVNALNNLVTNCTILGSSQATGGGTIILGSGSGNVISHCNIGPVGTFLPANSIYCPSSPSQDTVKNCNIYDFFSTTLPSSGVTIGTSAASIAIKDNKFYQTAARTSNNPAMAHYVIRVESPLGNNHLISGNTIGYSSSNETGNYTLTGYSNFSFTPIYLNVGSSGVTNVQGNTITNISYTQQQASVVFSAINAVSGPVNVGDLVPNVIGSMSSTGSISLTGSTGSMDNYAIRCAGSSNKTVSNNFIGGITITKSTNDLTPVKFTCIGNLSSGTFTCRNNVIGGNIANSVQANCASECNLDLTGILNGAGTATINGNTIKNLNVNSTASSNGFIMTATGITLTSNTTDNLISQNIIHSLGITGTTVNANIVNGIYLNPTSGSCTVERNFIHSLTAVSANIINNGISVAYGTSTFKNNFIRLGINSSGNGINAGCLIRGMYESDGSNNFYFNSVYIGGSPTAGTSNTFAFQSTVDAITRNYYDNIFYNARSNNGSTGKHYSISVGGTTPNPAGLLCNYNVLYSNGTGSVLGLFNGVDRLNLNEWKAATGKDSNSIYGNPQYTNPAGDTASIDLHLGINPSIAEGSGFPIASVPEDYDGELRSALSPTDIGADAGNYSPATPLAGDYTIGLAMFNSIAGTNVYFERTVKKVLKKVEYDLMKEVEEETFVPMQNGKIYTGPLFVKRSHRPGLRGDAMLGVYATITAALNDLYYSGASGAVRFLLLDANYNSETLPLTISPWTGTSAVNTLTIKPAAGVTATISGSETIFDINDGDYFILDGSNLNNGNTKDLTIANTSTSTSTIRFINDAKKNIVKNCIVKGNSVSAANGVIFFSTTTGTSGNDSNLVQNNDITKNTSSPVFCIYNLGTGSTSASKNSNNKITGNRCFDFRSRGIVDEGNSASALYEGNEIFSASVQPSILVGIRITGSTIEGFTIRNNYIHDLKTAATTLVYGIEINSIQAFFTGEIYNNFISLSETISNDMRGIIETAPVSNNLNICFNTVNIFGTVSGVKSSVCYQRTNGSNTNFKNNILVNTRNGGTGKHYAIRTNTPLNTFVCDYNDIFAGGGTGNVFGMVDANERTSLASWQIATGKDSNSVSADPKFVSNTNLHIDSTQSSPVSEGGISIAGITTDFDYNIRSLSTPDIGADEFNPASQPIELDLTMLIEGFYNSSSDLQVSDTIRVFLRNSTSPYAGVDSAIAVVNDSGRASMTFTNAASGNYYIQIRHRNALETWSADAIAMTQGGTANYNFTTSASQAFGDNIKQVDTSPDRFAIFSGDVNHDEVVDLSDITTVFNDANSFLSGYIKTDLTGDNFVDLTDLTIAFNNSNAFVGVMKP